MKKIGEAGFAIGFSLLFIGGAFLNIPMIFAGLAGMLAAGAYVDSI